MDNFIITPTNDLDELEQQIQAWYRLPFNLRMRSNDECIRQYGMSVLDLYNSNKTRIMDAKSKEEVDPNNLSIVGEAFEFDNIDPYLLAKSKEIQSSPYIVILDPDIISKTELEDKYSMFNSLNVKNRRLSNDFSYNLWGYNVYNMYDILFTKIETEEDRPDRDNIVILDDSEEQAKLEAVIEPLYNLYNAAMIHNNELDKAIIKANIAETVDANNINAYTLLHNFASFTLNFEDTMFDESILPLYTPYLLPEECNESMKLEGTNYYNQLISTECINLRNLYWNPFIPVNSNSLAMGRKRYARYFNECREIDIRGFEKYCTENNDPDKGLCPVFIVFGYDKNKNIFDSYIDYEKVGISFLNDFTRIYTIKGMEGTFSGFKKETYNDYGHMIISTILVTPEVKKKIEETIVKSLDNSITIDAKITPYTVILSKLQNKYSPDVMKILYKQYIDFILRLCNIEEDKFNNYANNVYKIYDGKSKDLRESYPVIKQLLSILLSSKSSETVIENFCNEYSVEEAVIMDIKYYLDPSMLTCIK